MLASASRRPANPLYKVYGLSVSRTSSVPCKAELKHLVTGALQRPISLYASASQRWPLPVAFVTCLLKGSASDVVTQKVVEGKDEVDAKRNFAFAAFSGSYLGCGQHYVYNVLFTRLFGVGQNFATAFKKVAADGLVHVPLVCHPLLFMMEDTVLRGGPIEGLARYSNEWLDIMKPYWSIWTFLHLFNFMVTPPELRIGLIACMSFLWLIILSLLSHKSYEAGQCKSSQDAP